MRNFSLFRGIRWFLLPGFIFVVSSVSGVAQDQVELPRYPSISPDGEEIIFSARGDLWKVSVDGGRALKLTSHEQRDLRSDWGPGGERVVFSSHRDGFRNLWLMNPDGTNIRQVTRSDRWCRNPAFGTDRDRKTMITFSGYHEADAYREQRPYYVRLKGGDIPRLHDAFGKEPRVSPSGDLVAFVRGGSYHGWEKKRYRGADNMDVYLKNREKETFTAVTEFNGDDGQPRWGQDDTLYLLSDRDHGTVNLFRVNRSGEETKLERLTDFTDRDIQHYDVSGDGSTAVLHVWDSLYTLDLENPDAEPRELSVTIGEYNAGIERLQDVSGEVTDVALSPDEQVMAYIAYGRVYVRNIKDNYPTRLVTPDTHARHKHVSWAPDGERLYFTSDRDGTWSIYAARVKRTKEEIQEAYDEKTGRNEGEPKSEGKEGDDARKKEANKNEGESGEREQKNKDKRPVLKRWHEAVSFEVTSVLSTEHNDRRARPSPDDRYLAFLRSQGDLMLYDLKNEDVRTLSEGWDRGIDFRWSPRSRYIAYSRNDMNFSSNIFIAPVEEEQDPVNITRHPRNDLYPRWSADGRKLVFLSNRTDRSYDVWKVYLDKVFEAYNERERAEYQKEETKRVSGRKPLAADPEKRKPDDEPPELELQDAYLRLKRVTSFPGHEFEPEITPAGDRIIFTASPGDDRQLYSVKWDGSDRKRLAGDAEVQGVSYNGNHVVLVRDGKAALVAPEGGKAEYIELSDRLRINTVRENLQKFREAARMMGLMFYHPDMKGVNWDQKVDQYRQLIRGVRTANEFNYVSNRLLGELSASHIGVNMDEPPSDLRQESGRIGARTRRINLAEGDYGFVLLDLVPDGPADLAPRGLREGDVITAINGRPFHETDTLMTHLEGIIDEEIVVTFQREQDGETREIQTLLEPISYDELETLRYETWRKENDRKVEEWSDGRIGYIHIESMNTDSLEKYERDLYAAAGNKDGLIMDVRNNGGGWTTDRILASIMTREHAYTIPRGANPEDTGHYPQSRLYIQRYTLPINMVANEKSFSNAEILAHAFKTLDRGNLVGQKTYGGVISTGSYSLVDGTTVRQPFRGWYLLDGTDMEGNGAVPDLLVPRTPEEEVEGKDRQLRRAVQNLMKRLK